MNNRKNGLGRGAIAGKDMVRKNKQDEHRVLELMIENIYPKGKASVEFMSKGIVKITTLSSLIVGNTYTLTNPADRQPMVINPPPQQAIIVKINSFCAHKDCYKGKIK